MKWDATNGLRCIVDGCDQQAEQGATCGRHSESAPVRKRFEARLISADGCEKTILFEHHPGVEVRTMLLGHRRTGRAFDMNAKMSPMEPVPQRRYGLDDEEIRHADQTHVCTYREVLE